MTQEELKMELEELAVRFSEGWHEGIKIDASDIMLLNEAAQALAQPEQEPVAWVAEAVCDGQYIDGRPRKIWWECNKGVGTAFYTTPPQRTEQEPYGYVSTHTNGQMHFNKTFNGVYRDTATEVVAVYTESTQRTEQEPVAWLSTDSIGERHLCFDKPLDNDPVQPLYTAPPQRTWVGLNDDEIDYLIHLAYTGDEEFVQTIEAKLKEKNT